MIEVHGIFAVRAQLREGANRARCLYIQKGRRDARINELISLAREQGIRYQAVEAAWFRRRLNGDELHQGVLLESQAVPLVREDEFFNMLPGLTRPVTVLVLDGVTDPRNLGACLRTANAAGVQAVILPKRRSAPINGIVLKTAQGGVESLRIVEVTNLARTLKRLADAGLWLVGTDEDARLAYVDASLDGDAAIILGSEDKGLRRLTREACDQLIAIPMHGSVESLNVSVAAGVILFERVRQLAL
ncbi:MAG: 23S rRNA (guanosine(2251)-2'-O)-methyltransferase RlmB [Pseudomonadota bacterium]|nr:23S rRNA (guanosine(2251)-2'-O)-methyltransferase RlmB [Pseudomonadota bacterium]